MTRDRILARRARFIAASMAALAGDGCAPAPNVANVPQPSPAAASSTSASTTPSASAAPTVVDSDGDGVPDVDDACPTVKGVPGSEPGKNGCPKLVAVVCLSIMIIERPYFAPGSSALAPEAKPVLDAAASVLKDHPEIAEVEVTGHCDAIEKPCPDEARARAVRDALVARGVAGSRLTAKAKGRDAPLDTNTTAEGRAKNRRVDLQVKPKP